MDSWVTATPVFSKLVNGLVKLQGRQGDDAFAGDFAPACSSWEGAWEKSTVKASLHGSPALSLHHAIHQFTVKQEWQRPRAEQLGPVACALLSGMVKCQPLFLWMVLAIAMPDIDTLHLHLLSQAAIPEVFIARNNRHCLMAYGMLPPWVW